MRQPFFRDVTLRQVPEQRLTQKNNSSPLNAQLVTTKSMQNLHGYWNKQRLGPSTWVEIWSS
jgi:hypothetical protein